MIEVYQCILTSLTMPILCLILFVDNKLSIDWMEIARYHELRLSYPQYLKMGSSLSNCQIDHYFLFQQIGKGRYGRVYIGIDDRTQKMVAFKLMDLTQIDKQPIEKVREIRRRLAVTQPELMMRCDSDNIVKCYDVYQNQAFKLMVIEYCNGPTLQKEIDDKGRIPEEGAVLILRQLICAIAQMHKKGIIHRDLKAENVMSHDGVYKVADFGFSKQMAQPKNEIHQTTLGTITTMAPEVLMRLPYGVKADIWSLGIIFFQMIFGVVPYDSRTVNKLCDQIQKKKILSGENFTYNGYTASKEVTAFLRDVLKVDPKERLNWEQLKSHPIFKESDKLGYQLRIKSVFLPQEKDQLQEEQYNSEEMQNKLLQESARTDIRSGEQVRPIRGAEVEMRRQSLSKATDEQRSLYRQVQEHHLECLKTELIYCQIVEKIIQNELFDLDDRDVIEMIYLMLTRALNNMSPINAKLKQSNEYFFQNQKQNVTRLYARVYTIWKLYEEKLTVAENKVTSWIFDGLCKIFASESLHKKDLFLTGIQTVDYSKQEQVEFTYSYINFLLDKMNGIRGTSLNYIRLLMIHYVRINAITLDQLQAAQLPFHQYIDQHIFSKQN